MTTIAVIGPGAIGGTVAAWLAQNPDFRLTLCARTPLDDLRIETPNGVITANPMVLTDPSTAQPVDWVLVATKTYDVDSTKAWLDRLVVQGTRVAIIQNGVEHVRLFEHLVPADQLVPVIINLPAVRTALGRIVQSRKGFIWAPAGHSGDEFAALFAHTDIEAAADADFLSRAWIKLCGNCGAIVPSLTLRATGPVWSDDLEAIVRGVAEECAAVGRAEGAIVPQSVVDGTVSNARDSREGSIAGSLHADRLAGNRMEIDARNGVIVRLGAKHGIPTPMNKVLVTLLAASGSPWVAGT
ncbi:2-dehydropantoate 2-reductase [Devosia psychrophila]|jgi:2-dehydropantoate 2-reductase|uniref:2-dehydropantoate 2-reductase n=1 Tax=Devosia psychrophila TaxID=728005 RepID=A0A0F5PU75_9HYPH|nr:2-dehydropantoate 2-reductase [Devosia psychrophila]KKC32183.1 2-dehydropantoate 2-reductase [Devosia psychrophila]SFC34386.1 ketopantoate reductase [Devosia psychrophila]